MYPYTKGERRMVGCHGHRDTVYEYFGKRLHVGGEKRRRLLYRVLVSPIDPDSSHPGVTY